VVVVFDNNVIISAAMFWTSIPAQALRKARKNGFKIIASQYTLTELYDTLLNSKFDKYVTESKRIEFYNIYEFALQIIPVTTTVIACRDPKDDMFLELAVSGNANIIISGDKDLMKMNPFRDIRIISPKEFIEQI
jgi:uncharacterized protein